jgi:hypothetical protein
MTKQPSWKFIVNIGDANPVEDGGVFVYEDETGVYSPEAEILEPRRHGLWKRYRVVLDRCTFIDGVLSDSKSNPGYPAWFADSIDSVISTCDCLDLVAWLCGDDVFDRARAYQSLWEYHGLENFDSQPYVIDPFKEMYTQGELGRCRK